MYVLQSIMALMGLGLAGWAGKSLRLQDGPTLQLGRNAGAMQADPKRNCLETIEAAALCGGRESVALIGGHHDLPRRD